VLVLENFTTEGEKVMSYQQDPYQQDPNQQWNQGQQQDPNQQWNQGQQQDPNQQWNQGQQQDPNQQWNQGQQQDPNQQWNQGQQQDPNQQWNQGQQQDPNQQWNQGGILGSAGQMAEGQVDQVIDQLGNKIPGGSQYTQQAKNVAHGAIGNLEQEFENRLRNMGGGNQGN
jgi:hypothetical protein